MHPAPSRHVVSSGHSGVSAHDSAPVHLASHEHDSLHLIRFLHERSPEHVMSHARSIPQWISSAQASTPEHRTSQLVASSHSTFFAHARSPHSTRHGRFGSQRMSTDWHESGALQSITHTPSTQLPREQPSAHRSIASPVAVVASGVAGVPSQAAPPVHAPSTQLCPGAQSDSAPHATVQSRTSGE